MSVNYRNEPVALRTLDPVTGTQAGGAAGNLARAFSSKVTRADPLFNVQPTFYPPLTAGVKPKDPFTPLMQAFEDDKVQVRLLVGAHEEGHNFAVTGNKWLFEPSEPNSGFRSSQMMGISEHFEFELPTLFADPGALQTDYMWGGGSTDDLWGGLWGLLRVYRGPVAAEAIPLAATGGSGKMGSFGGNKPTGTQAPILPLPNNQLGTRPISDETRASFANVCPITAPIRSYSVVAETIGQLVPGGTLAYNPRPGAAGVGPLNDPTAILYVQKADLDPAGVLKPGIALEPLVLRANAGDCIKVTLTNGLPAIGPLPDLDGFSMLPMLVEKFNMNQLATSKRVGLHPQLVSYNPRNSDGMEIGLNPASQIPSPSGSVTYTWYAGDVTVSANGTVTATPIEFGAVNLSPADRIKQPSKGLVGALVIEPQGSTWITDDQPGAPIAYRRTRTMATVFAPDGSFFREFVAVFQNDINLRFGDGTAIPNIGNEDDAEDAGAKAINYRTEPMWFRLGFKPDTPFSITRTFDFSNVLSSFAVWDPETPIFPAPPNSPVRFRVLHPGGTQRNSVFEIHGHIWQQEPYVNGSTQIGDNKKSLWEGARMGHGPTGHFDAVLQNGAGGKFGIPGDYLYRDHASFQFDGGIWGIFWVVDRADQGILPPAPLRLARP